MTAEPDADDPADLTGAAAESIVDHQEDEVDQLAADADRAGVGHGPDQS